MIIDLRSDTVTRPSPAMLEAMMKAEVGDDVFGEDPSVNKLEKMVAELFGMDEALFCPSGTMSNQIAIKCLTQPGDEVICDESAHVYQYEGGGIAFNSGASVKLLYGDRGRITAEQVLDSINPDETYKAHTSLVCLENTSNRGGGSCYDFQEILRIHKVCKAHNLSFYLDGARLFNALVARKETPEQYGKLFDGISVCLSKGLGCPAGSLLIGKKDIIKKARRVRKVLGGGMRQAGYLAAAGIYALENHISRLSEDHSRAQIIAGELSKKSFVSRVLPVETNIIIFELNETLSAGELVLRLKKNNIWCFAFAPQQVRLVLHRDVTEDMVHKTTEIIRQL